MTGNFEGKIPHRSIWENNIKIDVREIGWGCVLYSCDSGELF
jgi:hypothetical protein